MLIAWIWRYFDDMTNDEFLRDLQKLADGWCERRALKALSQFLPGYFALNGLTDGFAALETALKDVLVFAKDEITEEEKKEAKRLMILVQQAIYRR
jgi:hypothetical protein